jgi:hypothetical protein
MGLGALRGAFVVRKPVRTSDGMGGFTEVFQAAGVVRGQIEAIERLAYREAVAAQLGGKPPYRAVLSPHVQVEPGDVLTDVYGRNYSVVEVSKQDRLQVLLLGGM